MPSREVAARAVAMALFHFIFTGVPFPLESLAARYNGAPRAKFPRELSGARSWRTTLTHLLLSSGAGGGLFLERAGKAARSAFARLVVVSRVRRVISFCEGSFLGEGARAFERVILAFR